MMPQALDHHAAWRLKRQVTVHGAAGDWSIFRPINAFSDKPLAENMDLSPSRCPITHNFYS